MEYSPAVVFFDRDAASGSEETAVGKIHVSAVFQHQRGFPEIGFLAPAHGEVAEPAIGHIRGIYAARMAEQFQPERTFFRFDLFPVTVIVGDFQRYIGKLHIGNIVVQIAFQERVPVASGTDIGKGNMPDLPFRFFQSAEPAVRGNVKRQTAVDDDIVERDVFHLAAAGFVYIRQVSGMDSQSESGFVDDQIGDRTVADNAVADSDTYAAMTVHQHAVRNNDVFADALRIVFEPTVSVGTDGDHIVRRTDDTVGHRNIETAIDVDAVPVPAFPRGIGDPDAVNGHIAAAVQETAPIWRIPERDAADADII